jgi:WhiB family redox-sensing transcriptional regulator
MSSTWQDLLAAVGLAPALPGARCAGHSELWDETADPDIVEYTTEQCLHRCPALPACAAYLDGLSRARRPSGVVAGRIIRAPQPKRAAS